MLIGVKEQFAQTVNWAMNWERERIVTMTEAPVSLFADAAPTTMLKRDQAYAALSREIIRLRIAPGAMLDESLLSQQLGLGRTPIREALQRLAGEGLVTIYPRRGMIVTPLSYDDVRQQMEARLLWEPNIARLAARTGTAADWNGLDAILAETPATIETEDDVARASIVDRRFHRDIAVSTGNRYLVELIDRMAGLRARLPFLFFRNGTYQPVTDQHRAIVTALRAGDGERAAALLETHIRLTQSRQMHLAP